MTLVFASNNKHKLCEVRNILKFKILSLSDIGCFDELPETSDTIEGNASQKAFYIYHKYKTNCFADDTGLEIESLGGKPGVFSARYAGEHCSFEDNIKKVLREMKGIENRKAVFRCVISLIIDEKETQFEGRMKGTILNGKKGTEGFGYDPIFAPCLTPNPSPQGEGNLRSFAQMILEEKNQISHRAKAVKKMAGFLLQMK